VSFDVVNGDNSVVPGPADNKQYTVRGHITAPAGALDAPGPKAVTLYEHGHSFGEDFWNFKAVPGYDYVVQQAQQGLISVSVNKLGYGNSDHPPGSAVGYGSSATIMHQEVQDLRHGTYKVDGHKPVGFQKVVLAASTQAAFTAEDESYSFQDLDGIILMDFFDFGYAPGLFFSGYLGGGYAPNLTKCLLNVHDGYDHRHPNTKDFLSSDFFNAAPDVLNAFASKNAADPCGYDDSAYFLVPLNPLNASRITEPILEVYGDHDANFITPLAVATQALLFRSNHDVTFNEVKGSGIALPLQRTAPEFRDDVATWLKARYPYTKAPRQPPRATLQTRRTRLRHGSTMRLRLRCTAPGGQGTCTGRVRLRTRGKVAGRRRDLGHTTYALAAGRQGTVAVRLTRHRRRLMARYARHHRRLRVRARLGHHRGATFTLRLPRRHR
jgi:hypothetical protein